MTTPQEKREVYIKFVKDTYIVFYFDRKKYKRYSVAQFSKDVADLKRVTEWVKSQTNLILTPNTL